MVAQDLMIPLVRLNPSTMIFSVYYESSSIELKHRIDQLIELKKKYDRTKKGKWSWEGWTVIDKNLVIFE